MRPAKGWRRARGFTLLELLIVSALIATWAGWQAEAAEVRRDTKQREQAAQQLRWLERGALAHFGAESRATLARRERWPADMEALLASDEAAPFVAQAGTAPRTGGSWFLQVDENGATATLGIQSGRHPQLLANLLGPGASVREGSLHMLVGTGGGGFGGGADTAGFYLLDGSRALTGDLEAGGHDLLQVRRIVAQEVRTPLLVLEGEATVVRP